MGRLSKPLTLPILLAFGTRDHVRTRRPSADRLNMLAFGNAEIWQQFQLRAPASAVKHA
jgi:hypothetical protein